MSVDRPILRCVDDMAEQRGGMDSESSDSDVVSWISDPEDRSAGLPAYAFSTPPSGQITSGWHGARGGGRGAGGLTSVAPRVLREQNTRVLHAIFLVKPASYAMNHAFLKRVPPFWSI